MSDLEGLGDTAEASSPITEIGFMAPTDWHNLGDQPAQGRELQ